MNHPQNPAQVVRVMHDAVESGIDPLGITAPLAHAQMAWLSHPQELGERLAKLSSEVLELHWYTWLRAAGLAGNDPVRPQPEDSRFSDPIWRDSATWDITKEWYLLLTRSVQDMLYDTPGLSGKERRRAAFWWRKWLNAMAPTNFFWTNPVAVQKFVDTKGESLRQGYQNFLADLKAGNVRMTDLDAFTVGKDLATTPGAVVFRNRLLEVLHYTPTTEQVHETPIVIVTPWINKFYILDLNAKKSMIKFLVDQGFSVFVTSWKNPGAEMRDVTFDDYLTEGVDSIVDVARKFTGAAKVNAVGYCIGGTALSAYMAWVNAKAEKAGKPDSVPVANVTLFTTLVDFHKPGDIEVFVDEGSIRYLTKTMAQRGFLDGKEMASAFRLLRSNPLIWQYVVHGYLYGEKPPPFDVLFWNMDTTRMPYAMHSWYLRELYLHNKLVKPDALTIAEMPISLERIRQPVYAVGAEDDHIAPWRQTFLIAHSVNSETRYVLSSSGHILGIVNPVVNPPKRSFRAGTAARHESADEWQDRTPETQGSWWTDWMAWLKPQSGALVPAYATANRAFKKLADAPGTYVLEK